MLWLLLLLLPNLGSCLIAQQVHEDLVHYASYARLASCITRDKISANPLPYGACDLPFCVSNPRTTGTRVVKVVKAPLDENGTGYIAVDNQNREIIVAFRGSTSSADWSSDFQFMARNYTPISEHLGEHSDIPQCEGCKVHSGFYKNLRSITESFLKPVERLFTKYPDYKLVVTGHSLGAALASLLGIEFRVKGYRPLIYTYGGPRAFNPIMSNWLNLIFESNNLSERILAGKPIDWGLVRVLHDEDFVPMLPPKFKTAGVEFFIDKKDLPHTREDVGFLGVRYVETTTRKFQRILDLLHAYEHRTYFMTINKCDDRD